jgi:PLP dependent protein
MSIQQRYYDVLQNIGNLSKDQPPHFTPVTLLVVSKTQSIESVKQLASLGHVHFGENYVQEAVEKIKALEIYDLVWHFIGRIQSNKIGLIAKHFSWVHGVTTLAHAKKLNQARVGATERLNICIQVLLSGVSEKAGVQPSNVLDLVNEISMLPNLKIRGLMAMCEQQDSHLQRKQTYSSLLALKNEIAQTGIEMDTLSMGMSDDYEVAINAGATIVRVGSAIFGERGK